MATCLLDSTIQTTSSLMCFKQIKLRGPCDQSHTNTFQNKMALGKVILELYISIQGIVQYSIATLTVASLVNIFVQTILLMIEVRAHTKLCFKYWYGLFVPISS